MKRLILSFLSALVFSSPALAGQIYCSPGPIDHTKVAATLTNYTQIVYYSDVRLKVTGSGGHVNNSNGYDIRPYANSDCSSSAFTYKLLKYDGTNGKLEMAIKHSSLSSSVDTAIYFGYGDTSLTTDGSGNPWDGSTQAVWTFGDGTTLDVTDKTSNGNNGTNNGGTGTTGQIYGGLALDGSSHDVTLASSASLGSAIVSANQLTISAWVNPTDRTIYQFIYGKDTSNNAAPFEYRLDITSGMPTIIIGNGSGGFATHSGTSAPATGAWHLVIADADSTGTPAFHQYLDNTTNGSGAGTSIGFAGLADNGTTAYIGSRNDLLSYFKGSIDLLRIDKTIRSANWNTTWYNNTSSPSTFAPIGTEVTLGGGGGSTIHILSTTGFGQ